MTNIHELERRWKRYKIKQYRPYIIVLAILFILTFLTLLFSSRLFNAQTHSSSVVIQVPQKEIIKEDVILEENSSLPQLPLQSEPEVNTSIEIIPTIEELKPSFTFMQEIDEKRYEPQQSAKPIESVPQKHTATKEVVDEKEVVEHEVKIASGVSLSSPSKKQKILSLEARFKSSKNPNLGIVITKYYYDQKEYESAYKFALEVNAIDQKNEQSWLFAAQSLYHLNKKEQAISLLRSFLRLSNSQAAQNLLKTIQQGDLK